MKQLIVISIISIVLLQSCSYSTMLYMINFSAKPITIQYQIATIPNDRYYIFSHNPETGTIDKTKKDLTLIPSTGNVSFNKEQNIVTVVLQPYQALSVGDCRIFNKKDSACRNTITANVKWLNVISDTDTLHCPQRMIPDLFNLNDDHQAIYSVY